MATARFFTGASDLILPSLKVIMRLANWAMSVSYTHLDVYKRQALACLTVLACRFLVSQARPFQAFSVGFSCWRMSVQGSNQWAGHLALALSLIHI